MKYAKKLEMHHVEAIDHLVQPEEMHELNLDSPALNIIRDFTRHKPLTINETENIIQAKELMERTHTSVRLVINKSGEFVGVLTHQDLDGQKVMERLSARIEKEDIFVKDIMTSRSEEMAIRYSALENAKISDVVKTLEEYGQEHCLVIEQSKHIIRGIIFSSDIASRVHVPVHIDKKPTFLDLFRILNH